MKKWQKKVQFLQINKMILHTLKKDKRLTSAAIFLLTCILLTASCKKVESDLGIDVLPGEDLLNMSVDTFEVSSYIQLEDTLHTDELSNNLIGTYIDPVFGKTSASFYTQLRLSAFNPQFDTLNPIVDSVVLSLKLSGHYGNETSQAFQVYSLTEDIFIDSTYYGNSAKTNDGIDLVKSGFGTITPSLTNNPVVGGDTLNPQIRIRLDEAFGNMIVNANASYLSSDDSFSLLVKGLYVAVDTNLSNSDGGIYSIDMEHSESKISIYYHTSFDTSKFDLLINDKCARFTHFDHNYTGTAIAQQLADSALGNTNYYLQAGQGIGARLFFPNLFDIQNEGNLIINKAELYLPVQYYSIDPLAPPTRIIAQGVDDNGENYTMPDVSLGLSVFGGNYDDEIKAYKFNILRYIQDVLRGDVSNNPIKLSATAASVSANRVILSGKNSPNREKPYLKIYYTKY